MTSPTSRRVLVITGDPLGERLSGPGIRAWNISRLLAEKHEVRLVSFTRAEASSPDFAVSFVAPRDNRGIAVHEKWADVVIVQGHAFGVFRGLRATRKIVVVDIYDPMHLEQLEQGKHLSRSAWADRIVSADRALEFQLRRGDFFVCASEGQRAFWLGQLMSAGRINPETYDDDVTLRRLIDVAPFGLAREAPHAQAHGIRGVIPGIDTSDKVILWSGGLYDWFDPLGLIRAVAELAKRRPSVKLFFMGTKHPNPDVPPMPIVTAAREVAAALGVLDKNVFFNDHWVEFDKRQNYLLDADLGVSTHFTHVETEFSFRTRILDYLWAGLPMVVTEGDYFANLIAAEGMGEVVPSGDVTALSAALERVLFTPKVAHAMRDRVHDVRTRFYWDIVTAPLGDFVDEAHHAADRARVPLLGFRLPVLVRARFFAAGLRHRAVRARDILLRRGRRHD